MKKLSHHFFALIIALSSVFLFSAKNVLAKANLSITATDITFSKENPLEGDKVRIFARVFNPSDVDISGFVLFLNNGKEMADPQPVSVKVNTYDDVFIDWISTSGNHDIQAKIVSTNPKDENSEDDLAIQKNYFIDMDTDKDGIGNAKDKENIIATSSNKEEGGQAEENALEGRENQTGFFSGVASNTVAVVKSVTQNINKFADSQKENLEKKKEEVKRGLAEKEKAKNENASSGEKVKIEKPLTYALLASLSAVSFVLGHKIIFYLVLAFALYQVSKFLFRRLKKT